MPMSSSEGKNWTERCLDALSKTTPLDRFLDIGVGEGTYSNLFRTKFGGRWTGVEIFEPYVERFKLDEKYDDLLIGDARTLAVPAADVVFCGDVLEHMLEREAILLVKRLLAQCEVLFMSVPIIPFPQGEVDGNPAEAHLTDWTHQKVLEAFPDIVGWCRGNVVGVYALTRKAVARRSLIGRYETLSPADAGPLFSALSNPRSASAWMALAHHHYHRAEWPQCFAAASHATSADDDLKEGETPHLYLCIAAWNLGMQDIARRHGGLALQRYPDDPLLQANVRAMT